MGWTMVVAIAWTTSTSLQATNPFMISGFSTKEDCQAAATIVAQGSPKGAVNGWAEAVCIEIK